MSSRAWSRELTLAAAPEQVYTAVTDPAWIVRWFATRATAIANGLRLEFDMPDGTIAIDCETLAAVPGRRFAFRWESENRGHYTDAIFDIAPAPGGCRLAFRTTGFGAGPEWDRAYAEESAGWDEVLTRLERLLGPRGAS